ncbi:MAG: LCP family protein [Clostridia bacterium]
MGDTIKPGRQSDRGKTTKQPRKSGTGKKRSWKRYLLMMGLLLLVSGGAAAGFLYWQFNQLMDNVSQPTDKDGVVTVKPGVSPAYEPDQSISMVILGRDTRKKAGGLNTDVMMVASINPNNKKVTMLSIPRDTRIKLSGYQGYEKINAVYALGEGQKRLAERNGQKPMENGVTLVKQTLEDVLGIPIQYYVEVDFQGFQAVIDQLGGVKVNVDRKLVYDDPTDGTHINLKPGLQVLNGDQALDYVRHRHDNRGSKYYSSDFDRNRRQVEVIAAVTDKLKTFDGITKIFDIMKIGGDHIRTDMPADKIKGIALDFNDLSSDSIVSLENGAYWVGAGPHNSFTYFPNDQLAAIRTVFQTEMNVKPESLGKLNDSVALGSKEKIVPTTATDKPAPPKKETDAQKPQEPAKKPSKPVESKPTESAQPGNADETQAPPPDYADPANAGSPNPTDTDPTQPPADYAEQPSQS